MLNKLKLKTPWADRKYRYLSRKTKKEFSNSKNK